MSDYVLWSRPLRAPLACALLFGMSLAHAAGIPVLSASYDRSDRTVVVSGRLEGFGSATTVTVRNPDTRVAMATAVPAGNGSFIVRVRVPSSAQVPCSISAEARNSSQAASKTAELRNSQGACGTTKYTVSLSGVVTDAVIPFARVTVTVGGVTYTTVADANGRYTLPITTANLAELVKIEAAGTSPATGTPIEFVNLVGSFSRVLNEQQTTGSVEGNVTNVTTASYVLVLAANDGEPTGEAELKKAETSVDATQLLQLAALIKLIVDDPDYSLPEGETSLLEFISKPEAVAAQLETVPQEDLDAALASILQDSNLVAGFSATELPSRYYVIPAAQPGYLARQGRILEFNADGTGRLMDYDNVGGQPINEPYTWVVQDGRLIVDFATPVANVSYEMLSNTARFGSLLTDAERGRIAAANGPNAQIPVLYSGLGYAFTRVADGALVDNASVETRWLVEVLPFTLNDGTGFTPTRPAVAETAVGGQSLRASGDVQARRFTASCPGAGGAICVPGQWLANFLYSPGLRNGQPLAEAPYGDVATFAPDGTVTGLLSGLTASWTVDGDGALLVNYPSGWQQKVQIVESQGIEFGTFNEFSRGNDRYATYTINVKAADGFVFNNAYLANGAGKFWQGEINSWVPEPNWWNPDGTRALSSYFGWQFFAGSNAAVNVFGVSLQDCGGDGKKDDPYASLAFGTWQPVGSGVAIPRGGGSRLRTWYPAASTVVDGERQLYVMEDERYVSGALQGQFFIPPRINLLREIDAPWVCSN